MGIDSAQGFKLYLLGLFRLEKDSRSIHLPRQKLKALLAYLALYPQKHSREKLAALLWGDFTDTQAAASLRNALPILRNTLGDDLLLIDRETIQLNPAFPLWVDAFQFTGRLGNGIIKRDLPQEYLEEAIDLYQGELFADSYDDWVSPVREQYHTLYVDALLQLAHHLRSKSEYPRAAECAQKVLATAPANETAHQHLMFCHLMMGNRQAAMEQYSRCKQALETELATEPSPETTALFQWLEKKKTDFPSSAARITNLPIPVSSFVGRKKEMWDLKEIIVRERLVTITGVGGSGKTRLAIQVATDLIDSFKDGVWWVELAGLNDSSMVPPQIVRALGIPEVPGQALMDILGEFLETRQTLLVMDNCEHLIEACAQIANQLITRSPNLHFLATSRERLGITGEMVWQTPTMNVPSLQSNSLTSFLMQFEGIHLFVERAREVDAGFVLNEHNALAVAQICSHLDGIPLAIELAAAWVKALTADQIASRLDNRFALLTTGSRTALPRQQTLHTLIEWSYDLLPEIERRLFQRLSVFSGGTTLEAIESICTGDDIQPEQVPGLLLRLSDKSIISIETQDGGKLYGMLETIREFAREKLILEGGAKAISDRHLEFFMLAAEQGGRELFGSRQLEWIERLERDQDNFRAALEWSKTNGNILFGMRLAAALWRYWSRRGFLKEGLEILAKLLEHPNASNNELAIPRAQVLLGAGYFALAMAENSISEAYYAEALEIGRNHENDEIVSLALNGLASLADGSKDVARSKTLYEESLTVGRRMGDPKRIGTALANLGMSASDHGDFLVAHQYLQEALELFEKEKDIHNAATVQFFLGRLARRQRKFDETRVYAEKSLAAQRKVGAKLYISAVLIDLTWVAINDGKLDLARNFAQESLHLSQEVRSIDNLLMLLDVFAALAEREGQSSRAVHLLAACEALQESTNVHVTSSDRVEHEDTLARVRQKVAPPEFKTLWELGSRMTMEQAVEYASEDPIEKS